MSGIKVTKSPNFDRNLNSTEALRVLSANFKKNLRVARESSNQIAPIDDGTLRKSATVHDTGLTSGYIEWDVPYANRRYFENKKNPQTKEWCKQDYEKHKEGYLKNLTKGVIL